MSLASNVFRVPHAMVRLVALPPSDWADLLRAQWALIVARFALVVRPAGDWLRPRRATSPHAAGTREPDASCVERQVVAIDRAATWGLFTPTCLVRAAALERMLVSCGSQTAVLRVGVFRSAHTFLAHAWIEVDGRVVGDSAAHVQQFTPLQDFSALSS